MIMIMFFLKGGKKTVQSHENFTSYSKPRRSFPPQGENSGGLTETLASVKIFSPQVPRFIQS
jgi:hypothetical protein